MKYFKKTVAAFFLFATLIGFGEILNVDTDSVVTSTAKAQYDGLFTCYAQSTHGGQSYYTHYNRSVAARRAIQICRQNSSVYAYCSFVGCDPW